jgi:hypothetical protein
VLAQLEGADSFRLLLLLLLLLLLPIHSAKVLELG